MQNKHDLCILWPIWHIGKYITSQMSLNIGINNVGTFYCLQCCFGVSENENENVGGKMRTSVHYQTNPSFIIAGLCLLGVSNAAIWLVQMCHMCSHYRRSGKMPIYEFASLYYMSLLTKCHGKSSVCMCSLFDSNFQHSPAPVGSHISHFWLFLNLVFRISDRFAPRMRQWDNIWCIKAHLQYITTRM